jgi:hypothetical protein
MLSNTVIILLTVVPFIVLFALACVTFLLYKLCWTRRRGRDEEEHFLLSNYSVEYSSSNGGGESVQIQTQSDLNLIDKVKQERMQLNTKSRESAYVHMQFFLRSSSYATNFRLVEHLSFIGANTMNPYRNWFVIRDTTTANVNKLVVVDYTKSSGKKQRLVDIAYTMKHDLGEMAQLIATLLKSVRHVNVLAFDHVDVDFYNDRVLLVMGLSADGSLRDHMHATNALDNMAAKLKKIRGTSNATPLLLKTVQSYAKQILAGLVYLNKKLVYPVDTLHSGNIILSEKRRRCLITGYENEIFAYKTKQDRLNDDLRLKLVKTYLVKSNSGSGNNEAQKPRTEQDIKQAIQVLRFGLIIVEMCTGMVIFLEKLAVPKQVALQAELLNRYGRSGRAEANALISFINCVFFNRGFANADDEKMRKKFVVPRLSELLEHEFLKNVRVDDQGSGSNEFDTDLDASQLEFLNYMAGNREIKAKKTKKKPSRLSQFSFGRHRLSVIEETEGSVNETSFGTSPKTPVQQSASFSNQNQQVSIQTGPPPPPPPPPPTMFSGALPPPPPPPGPALSKISSIPPPPITSDRSSLLDNIRMGTTLKKTVTVDKSKPVF